MWSKIQRAPPKMFSSGHFCILFFFAETSNIKQPQQYPPRRHPNRSYYKALEIIHIDLDFPVGICKDEPSRWDMLAHDTVTGSMY